LNSFRLHLPELRPGQRRALAQTEGGDTWHHANEQLFGLANHGPGLYVEPGYETDMPAYAGVLSDEEICVVLAHIKSAGAPRIRQQAQR